MSGDDARSEATVAETLALARPSARRLALASLLGAGAIGAGIGLLATSAWLISRASQHPPESALALAIVAVQFFGLSKGMFRYGQRLVGHDAAFRALADLRVHMYTRLESLAPAGAAGDAQRGSVGAVRPRRGFAAGLAGAGDPPFAIAVLVGGATVSLIWWILPGGRD